MVDGSVPGIFAHIEKPSPQVKAIIEKLTAAYTAATETDRAEVNKLIERAKTGKRDSTVVKLTPGMAAILFVEHNRNNREWSPTKTAEYAEQITSDEWEFTHQGLGFLESGDMSDGQHRAAGVALAGQTVEMTVRRHHRDRHRQSPTGVRFPWHRQSGCRSEAEAGHG